MAHHLDTTNVGSLPPVHVCLLGGFRLLARGRAVPVRRGSKREALISNLALGPSPGIDRDELLGLLWPGATAPLASQSLNTLVYAIQRSLQGALAGGAPIVHDDGRYRLNTERGVVVDVAQFDAAIDAADGLTRAGRDDDAVRRYDQAAVLYEGDLVFGSHVEHVIERERLRARYLRARARLADHEFAAGRYSAALRDALAVLAYDSCREDAHRMAMKSYVRLGERAQALRQYRLCREVLDREFEAPPERATEELYELVRLDPSRV